MTCKMMNDSSRSQPEEKFDPARCCDCTHLCHSPIHACSLGGVQAGPHSFDRAPCLAVSPRGFIPCFLLLARKKVPLLLTRRHTHLKRLVPFCLARAGAERRGTVSASPLGVARRQGGTERGRRNCVERKCGRAAPKKQTHPCFAPPLSLLVALPGPAFA